MRDYGINECLFALDISNVICVLKRYILLERYTCVALRDEVRSYCWHVGETQNNICFISRSGALKYIRNNMCF